VEDTNSNSGDKVDGEDQLDPTMLQEAADAISEIMSDVEIETDYDEAITIAKQLFEKFTSPLMIQKAAGATSSVTITGSPTGSVESARSVKVRNVQFNLKDAAIALPATLPAFITFYEKHGISDNIGQVSVLAVLYLFSLLKTLSSVLQIPLTKRTAGVLQVLWASKKENEDSVPHNGLLEKANSRFEEYQWQKINDEELVSHLETLEKIGCIERVQWPDSIAIEKIRWRLKERVKLTY
jgi:hypothetical protein